VAVSPQTIEESIVSIRAPRTPPLRCELMRTMQILRGLLFSGVFLFCIYGALASLEPTAGSPIHTGWFFGYCVIGLGSLCTSVSLFRSKKPLG